MQKQQEQSVDVLDSLTKLMAILRPHNVVTRNALSATALNILDGVTDATATTEDVEKAATVYRLVEAKTQPDEDELLSVPDVAERIGQSAQNVRNALAQGRLKGTKRDGQVMISWADVQTWRANVTPVRKRKTA